MPRQKALPQVTHSCQYGSNPGTEGYESCASPLNHARALVQRKQVTTCQRCIFDMGKLQFYSFFFPRKEFYVNY